MGDHGDAGPRGTGNPDNSGGGRRPHAGALRAGGGLRLHHDPYADRGYEHRRSTGGRERDERTGGIRGGYSHQDHLRDGETGTQKRTSSGDGGDFSPASGEADRENRDSGRRMSGDGDIGKHDDGALLSGAGRLDRIFFSLRAGDNRTGIFQGKGTGTGFCGRGVFYAGDFQLCGRRYCQRPSSDGFLPEG